MAGRRKDRLLAIVLGSGILAGCSENQTQAVVPATKPENIVIAVDGDENIYCNGERVSEAELFARLQAESKTPLEETRAASSAVAVTLEILKYGTFIWNGERVPNAEALEPYWKVVASQQPQPEIHLKPNPEAAYDSVARALEGAQRNGVTNLGFIGNAAP